MDLNQIDWFSVGLIALAVLLFFFIFRNQRRRQREAAELQEKMVPGVEVMTAHGIFGRLISLDEQTNEAVLETTPGTKIRVHRQTLTRIVEPEQAPADDTPAE